MNHVATRLTAQARYMQILSSRVCEAVDVINVHHGMLVRRACESFADFAASLVRRI